MRIALMAQLAPRKLGSGEGLAVAICREAVWRGHEVDFYCRAPVHSGFDEALRRLDVRWRLLDELERHPLRAVRALSRYDILHLSFFGPRALVPMLAYAAHPARVLFLGRSQHPWREPGEGRWVRFRRSLLDRFTMRRVASLGGVSDWVRDDQRARYHFPERRCRTLHNGVDLDRFHPPEQEREGRPRILCVAYLKPHKGIHHVLNAFSRVERRDATLRIVGDGSEELRLRALARTLRIADRVEFLSLRDDVPKQMREAQVFVHASYLEAFGLAVAEAMASARAVIASPVGGVPELIADGESGLLVRPGDEAGLTAAMDRLLGDSELRSRLGENARARVRGHFDVQIAAVRHVDWCEEVARWKRATSSRTVPVSPQASAQRPGWAARPELPPLGETGVPSRRDATRAERVSAPSLSEVNAPSAAEAP